MIAHRGQILHSDRDGPNLLHPPCSLQDTTRYAIFQGQSADAPPDLARALLPEQTAGRVKRCTDYSPAQSSREALLSAEWIRSRTAHRGATFLGRFLVSRSRQATRKVAPQDPDYTSCMSGVSRFDCQMAQAKPITETASAPQNRLSCGLAPSGK